LPLVSILFDTLPLIFRDGIRCVAIWDITE